MDTGFDSRRVCWIISPVNQNRKGTVMKIDATIEIDADTAMLTVAINGKLVWTVHVPSEGPQIRRLSGNVLDAMLARVNGFRENCEQD
jgi:hypothetical protein